MYLDHVKEAIALFLPSSVLLENAQECLRLSFNCLNFSKWHLSNTIAPITASVQCRKYQDYNKDKQGRLELCKSNSANLEV
ncbi:MAG TPA: hypothetical protein VE956_10105 [Nodularia sp. (in: cyanobacteria)]|nr:hypothetical protein [Nodularia sp. (in: cyanobacteria)]